MPKYPNILITLDMDGPGGNVFSIVGRVQRALQSEGASYEEREKFKHDCLSGDYKHVLETVREWVEVEE